MISPGVYPASVTSLAANGRIDILGMAKLLAYFEANGCMGAVLAGTNGEGPSLSAVEKRDLIRDAAPLKGKLALILGVATPSLDEAVWLCRRAEEFHAAGVLMMAPYYFRSVDEQAIGDWFLSALDKSPVPTLIYNFPKMTGVTISHGLMARLAEHPMMAGCKDSSGERDNLAGYKSAMRRPEQVLFVGNEALLIDALKAGWSGTISGAANVLSLWLSQIVDEWFGGKKESAEEKFKLIEPIIESIRTHPQPATHKAMLHAWSVLPSPDVRLPLTNVEVSTASDILALMGERIGQKG